MLLPLRNLARCPTEIQTSWSTLQQAMGTQQLHPRPQTLSPSRRWILSHTEHVVWKHTGCNHYTNVNISPDPSCHTWDLRGKKQSMEKWLTDDCSRSCWREKLSKCKKMRQKHIMEITVYSKYQSLRQRQMRWTDLIEMYPPSGFYSLFSSSLFSPFAVWPCASPRMKGHQINPMSLRFMDGKLEDHYSSEKEKRSGAAFCCCLIVLLFITAMEIFIDPQ